MAVERPFKRTFRPFVGNDYKHKCGQAAYVRAESYSTDPRAHCRSFEIIQREVRSLFEFIEPADINRSSYSLRIGSLLTSVCFEIESNFKAILRENSYVRYSSRDPQRAVDPTMDDYRRVEASHHLSHYTVRLPEWHGTGSEIKPFLSWANGSQSGLPWYQAYNAYKHDRVLNLDHANFGNLIDAFCGLYSLLCSQFGLAEFSAEQSVRGWADHSPADKFELGMSRYLRVKFPEDWREDEMYGFNLTAAHFADPNFAQNFQY